MSTTTIPTKLAHDIAARLCQEADTAARELRTRLIDCMADATSPGLDESIDDIRSRLRALPREAISPDEYRKGLAAEERRLQVAVNGPAPIEPAANATEVEREQWQHIDALPTVGDFIEIELASGKLVRGHVTKIDDDKSLRISGVDARPEPYSKWHGGVWWTWAKHDEGVHDCEVRVRWRHVSQKNEPGSLAETSEWRANLEADQEAEQDEFKPVAGPLSLLIFVDGEYAEARDACATPREREVIIMGGERFRVHLVEWPSGSIAHVHTQPLLRLPSAAGGPF